MYGTVVSTSAADVLLSTAKFDLTKGSFNILTLNGAYTGITSVYVNIVAFDQKRQTLYTAINGDVTYIYTTDVNLGVPKAPYSIGASMILHLIYDNPNSRLLVLYQANNSTLLAAVEPQSVTPLLTVSPSYTTYWNGALDEKGQIYYLLTQGPNGPEVLTFDLSTGKLVSNFPVKISGFGKGIFCDSQSEALVGMTTNTRGQESYFIQVYPNSGDSASLVVSTTVVQTAFDPIGGNLFWGDQSGALFVFPLATKVASKNSTFGVETVSIVWSNT